MPFWSLYPFLQLHLILLPYLQDPSLFLEAVTLLSGAFLWRLIQAKEPSEAPAFFYGPHKRNETLPREWWPKRTMTFYWGAWCSQGDHDYRESEVCSFIRFILSKNFMTLTFPSRTICTYRVEFEKYFWQSRFSSDPCVEKETFLI